MAFCLLKARDGYLIGAGGGPPCETFSAARYVNDNGPAPVRSGCKDFVCEAADGSFDTARAKVYPSSLNDVLATGIFHFAQQLREDSGDSGECPANLNDVRAFEYGGPAHSARLLRLIHISLVAFVSLWHVQCSVTVQAFQAAFATVTAKLQKGAWKVADSDSHHKHSIFR